MQARRPQTEAGHACYGGQMGSIYLDESVRKLKEFEGSVGWMYLDTVGKVTVGVGLMLPNALAAQSLAFMRGEQPATAEEIAAEYARVLGLQKGRLAKFYSQSRGLRLSDDTIEEKLRDTLAGFEGYLRKHIAIYDTLPDVAKIALLDMVYNLGPGKLFAEYPRLIAALEAGDWKTAAEHSQRRGPAPARNQWTKLQFLSAAKQIQADLQAVGESPAVRWIWGGFAALFVTLLALEIIGRAERR